MQVGANIFLVVTGLSEILIKLSESFLNPGHEFLLHDIAGDANVCEMLGIGFGEDVAIEAVIFLMMGKWYRKEERVFPCE